MDETAATTAAAPTSEKSGQWEADLSRLLTDPELTSHQVLLLLFIWAACDAERASEANNERPKPSRAEAAAAVVAAMTGAGGAPATGPCHHCPSPRKSESDASWTKHVPACAVCMIRKGDAPGTEGQQRLQQFERRLEALRHSSAVKAALEFDFEDDAVVCVLAGYAFMGAAPRCAAEMVERLQKLEDEPECILKNVAKSVQKVLLEPQLRPVTPTNSASGRHRTAEASSVMPGPVVAPVKEAPQTPKSPGASAPVVTGPTWPSKPSHADLVEETARLLWLNKCRACQDGDATRLIVDCGHLVWCSKCSTHHDSCPKCGTRATFVIQVFRA